MNKIYISLSMLMLTSFICLPSYAIHVKVHSPSKHVFAIGFTVDGKRYGSLGSSYSNNNVPKGKYIFGLRAGHDVGCVTDQGNSSVQLTSDTSATLNYDGKNCRLHLSRG